MLALIHILTFLMASSTAIHDIHVSITDIEQDPSGRLEIAIKTFKDDLQVAVGLPQSGELSSEYVGSDELISQYVLDHFIIHREGNKFDLVYEESLNSGDAVWIYLKSKHPIESGEFTLQSTFMLELFDDQANIINLKGPNNEKLLLNRKTKQKRFNF